MKKQKTAIVDANNIRLSVTDLRTKRSLTPIEIARLCSKLSWEHIELFKGTSEVSGKCSMSHNMYRGPGVCIAKKYLKFNPAIDYDCSKCKSKEIVSQLNYIFKYAFEDRYKAEWINKRGRNNNGK
jgi:hypothetical protein